MIYKKKFAESKLLQSYWQQIQQVMGSRFEQALIVALGENLMYKTVWSYQSFLEALSDDAKKTQGIVRLTLARSGISSQLIDNLNASIHVRALLTDLFLLDEALKN